jgi:hypothetical protein
MSADLVWLILFYYLLLARMTGERGRSQVRRQPETQGLSPFILFTILKIQAQRYLVWWLKPRKLIK